MPITTVDVPAGDGVADARLATPDTGPAPAVLLFCDAFGLRPRLDDMIRRIAGLGYVVLAPNLLYRSARSPLVDPAELADPDRRGAVFGRLMPMVHALDTPALTRDVRAYLDFLDARDEVAPGPVAAVGYCMGGTNAVKAAEAYPQRFAAVAAFHAGRLVTDADDSPHRHVAAITAEVYLGHADGDGSNTAEQIAALESALTAAGVRHTSEVYAGATHGYTMADTAAYDEAAERRHWAALEGLLARTLG